MKTILLFGSSGFIGKNLLHFLKKENYKIYNPSSKNVNLLSFNSLDRYLRKLPKIDIIINSAAKIGGLGYMIAEPEKIFIENSQIIVNLVRATKKYNIENYLALGSACSYPDNTKKLMIEKNLWNGRINNKIEPYGMMKKFELTGLNSMKLKYQKFNYYYPILANVYGPGDNFDPNHSHVLGALIAKFVKAKRLNYKKVSIWGAGLAIRDFVFVDDVSKLICKMLKNDNLKNKIVNITSGEKVTIKQLVNLIKKITKFNGKIEWDKSKPEGIKFKALSDKKMKYYKLNSSVNLANGIKKTVNWFKKKY
tara:strand:- start:581 stop:1504 length:924 start_codon:yes stop_codon:yes gene_type:complete